MQVSCWSAQLRDYDSHNHENRHQILGGRNIRQSLSKYFGSHDRAMHTTYRSPKKLLLKRKFPFLGRCILCRRRNNVCWRNTSSSSYRFRRSDKAKTTQCEIDPPLFRRTNSHFFHSPKPQHRTKSALSGADKRCR